MSPLAPRRRTHKLLAEEFHPAFDATPRTTSTHATLPGHQTGKAASDKNGPAALAQPASGQLSTRWAVNSLLAVSNPPIASASPAKSFSPSSAHFPSAKSPSRRHPRMQMHLKRTASASPGVSCTHLDAALAAQSWSTVDAIVRCSPGTSHAELSRVLLAAASGQNVPPQLITLLLARGADAEARDELRRTPLIRAAASGAVHVVRALIHVPVALDAVDALGMTALHASAASQCPQSIDVGRLLLESGANAEGR